MIKSLKYKANQYSSTNRFFNRLLLIVFSFTIFFLFDFLSKSLLFQFDPKKQGIGVSYIVVGIRSFAHSNTTIISFLNFSVQPIIIGTITVVMFTIILLFCFLLKRKLNVFLFMVIGAGILGNGIDFLRFGFVQDILFLPWFDRGTFNVADVLIVIGGIGLALSVLINEIIRETKYESII